MRILFMHVNFPAQFGLIGQYLSRQGWDVSFGTRRKGMALEGVRQFYFEPHREVTEGVHHYTANYERAVLNGQAAARAAVALKNKGYAPDVIMAHSGWGPGMFLRDVWPDAKYAGYFEWYYNSPAPDSTFLHEGPVDLDERLRARARNAPILTDLVSCDGAIIPTAFQRDQFPEMFHEKMDILHDGVDTELFAPSDAAGLSIENLSLGPDAEIITYVARGMEPYRGFPELMRALERVLRDRPTAHAVIVGEDRVAYGKQLPKGDSYKARALAECDLDLSRVHFTGLLPRRDYRRVLQASSAHVYLTAPFVLSWSMLEAMSVGCPLIASDVAPVREAVTGAVEATLVDHRDTEALADAIIDTLSDKTAAHERGARARERVMRDYAIAKLYPEKMAWLAAL